MSLFALSGICFFADCSAYLLKHMRIKSTAFGLGEPGPCAEANTKLAPTFKS